MSISKNNNSDIAILLKDTPADGVLRLTLNDSKRRNALSEEMMTQMSSALEKASSNKDVKVIVISANGPAFCSGHDLKQMSAGREDVDDGKSYFTKVFASCSALMQQIVNHPKPVIAEVSGVAAAAGCQLVACCDLAIAADSARFVTPGVNIGLFCSTPMVALSRNVSNKAAMEMLLTGEMVDSKKAEKVGLVNRVVADDELDQETIDLARLIASKSSMALETGKKAFYSQKEMPLSEAYEFASKVMVDNMLKHDAKEGINAFIEKRQPEWKDK